MQQQGSLCKVRLADYALHQGILLKKFGKLEQEMPLCLETGFLYSERSQL